MDTKNTNDTELVINTEEATNRKKVENYILSYIGKIVTGEENVKLYKDMFAKMSNADFHRYMEGLRDGTITLSIIVPTNSKDINVDVANNYKLAKELNINFFQKLIVGAHDDIPEYKTNKEHMIVKLPIRRVKQTILHKISIPEDNKSIDTTTGTVTGKSQSSQLTYPELQVLTGLGLKYSIREAMKVRGGDIKTGERAQKLLYETGHVSQQEIHDPTTEVESTNTLRNYLLGAHIKSTL